jgi:hypothetical protein
MRHERFIPMEYANQELMDAWNDYNITLKVWLFPDQFGDKLADLQSRYPKPDLSEIDKMFTEVMYVLRKDSKPMIKY